MGVLAVGCAAPPPAENFLSGRIDATAFDDLPEGASVAVISPEETPRGIQLTRLLVSEMTARGIAVQSDAALVMTYRATTAAAPSPGGFPDIGLAGVVGSAGTRDVGLTIGLPIFGWGRRASGRYEYTVEMAIAERDGNRLWQARAAGLAGTKDIAEIARTVFPVLLQQIGRTVRGADMSGNQHLE